MKATGIVRQVDPLGRVVIPMELRKTMGIGEGTPMEIFVDGERIILQKYAPGCTFCGNPDGLKYIKGKPVCGECAGEAAELAK